MKFILYYYEEARMNRTKIQHYKRFPLMFQGLFVSEDFTRNILKKLAKRDFMTIYLRPHHVIILLKHEKDDLEFYPENGDIFTP